MEYFRPSTCPVYPGGLIIALGERNVYKMIALQAITGSS